MNEWTATTTIIPSDKSISEKEYDKRVVIIQGNQKLLRIRTGLNIKINIFYFKQEGNILHSSEIVWISHTTLRFNHTDSKVSL